MNGRSCESVCSKDASFSLALINDVLFSASANLNSKQVSTQNRRVCWKGLI